MIEISNLSKSFSNTIVLKNINLILPDNGLIAVCGPSGCGKTTLINCLSGLLHFDGHIKFNNYVLETLKEDELNHYRLTKCGFVFQDFKLFNNETVYRNVLFPLDVLSGESKSFKDKRIMDLLFLVGLKKSKNKLISKMSGGEKQRVAIARALVNNPKIVFADEPTGSLDSKNSEEVMKILRDISKTSLVIVVSHDIELIKKYADRIITLKDGNVVGDYINKLEQKNKCHLNLLKLNISSKKPVISLNFLIKHSFLSLKEKKFRTLFSTLMTSLALFGVGLCLSISSLVSSNIKSSYSAIIDEDQLIIENKEKVEVDDITSATYYDVNDIRNRFPEYIKDIGVHYYVNYETFFSTRNQFYIYGDGNKNVIEGISSRHIDEFKYLEESNEIFYPSKPSSLNDDEIAVSLTMDMIEDVCFALKIKRSVNSLSDYLLNHDLYIVLDVANDNWEYEDEQILNIKAFSLSFVPFIYHYNHMWNEYMFEDRMRFPTTDYLNKALNKPYLLRKLYFLEADPDYKDSFFNATISDNDFDAYRFEIAKNYYRYLYEEAENKDVTRIIVFNNPFHNFLSVSNTHYFKDESPYINKEIYGTNKGIVIYPSSLLMGFANSMFVSASEEKIDEVNDANSYLSQEDSKKLIIPDGVVGGCYYKIKSEGLTFSPLDDAKTLQYYEIIISSALAKSLFGEENPVGKKLYLSYVTNEISIGNKKVLKEFVNDELIIKGVQESTNKIIYHNTNWSILYFQLHLGISTFDLNVNNISFSLSEGYLPLDAEFPQYNFVRPLSDINKSIDEIVGYLTTALIIFSSTCILISILMLLLISNLNAKDAEKDIYLARVIGVSKKESKKFVTAHTYLLCFIALLMSVMELFVSTVLISKFILNSNPVFNPFGYLAMIGTSVAISLISVLCTRTKIT